jgi:uncharacterized protein (DUF2141 family)
MKLIIFSLITFLAHLPTNLYKLKVEVVGLRSNKGQVMMALYRETDDFPTKKGRYKYLLLTPHNHLATGVFDDLHPGKYAVAVILDENKSFDMDKNMFGFPLEQYGFSNNAREKLSAPSFQKASFELHSDRKIQIKIE